jgi:hypothetical protein
MRGLGTPGSGCLATNLGGAWAGGAGGSLRACAVSGADLVGRGAAATPAVDDGCGSA